MPENARDEIVELYDAGNTAEEIADELKMSLGYVYSVLRVDRPDRPRKKHKTTSNVPAKILDTVAAGVRPSAVAKKLRVSRAYVYKCLKAASNRDAE